MDIKSLQYLIAVAEHQHFGKAADSCCVSQPGLSMQLKKLEDELGIQLFERSNKQVLITQAGQRILDKAKVIILGVNDLKECAAIHSPFADPIRFGAFPTLAPYLFPSIVPALKQYYPDLRLRLAEEKSEVLLETLREGKLDLALLALPIEDNQLTICPLFDDPFYLAVSSAHPFAARQTIFQADLIDQELLLLNDGHCLRDQVLDLCQTVKAREHLEFQCASLETLRQMVVANEAITLIPKTAIVKSPYICYIPFSDPSPPCRTIALVWRKSSGRVDCFEKIAALISKLVRESVTV